MPKNIPDIKATASKKSIMAMVLENMRRNVIAGIEDTQDRGISCRMPDYIDIEMPLDSNGLPVTDTKSTVAARVRTRLWIAKDYRATPKT